MNENNTPVEPTQVPPVADSTTPVTFTTPRDPAQPEVTQSAPAENLSRPESSDPHAVDEDPEDQPVGQELSDPWDGKSETWPSVESQVEDKTDHTEGDNAS